MLIQRVMFYASDPHGLSGDVGGAAGFEPETVNRAQGVDFVIVGAFAVAYHGHPHYTGDLDILVRQDPDTIARIVSGPFGFPPLAESSNRLHVLLHLDGVDTDAVWAGRVRGTLYGLPVWFLGRDELLSSQRPDDSADVAELLARSAPP